MADPFLAGALDGFCDGVATLGKPIGAVEHERHRNFLAGGLHGPGIVTAALRISRLI